MVPHSSQHLTGEERELENEIATLTRELPPQLLNEPSVGSPTAARLLLSWSHPGGVRSDAAFARLAGAAPIPASSGRTIRYRLDRSGDRLLNRAGHQPTIDYIASRRQDGKTTRDATRCLKRYLARNLYRLLEHPPTIA